MQLSPLLHQLDFSDRKLSTRNPVVFLISVDWFFMSHFQHLARRVISDGGAAILASQLGHASARLAKDGVTLVDLPFRRGGLQSRGLAASVRTVEQLISELGEPVLHAFGNFGVLVGALATRRFPNIRRVYTITGRGYMAVAKSLPIRAFSYSTCLFNRVVADTPNTRWIVENTDDIFQSGLSRAQRQDRVAIVGGAGVDPNFFVQTKLPPRPPLRIGFVSRLIWSKGLDIAVRAVELARSRGIDVTLTVAGAADIGNPRAFSAAQLASFASIPGVQFVGRIDNVRKFWCDHHVAFLPSRGGEGLPRSLLEAASCGRPVLVSNTPGCEDFSVATNGWVFPVEDAQAASACIAQIAACDDLEMRGTFARSVVKQHYSEAKVWEIVEKQYFE